MFEKYTKTTKTDKNFGNSTQYKAFTLAEVLIVLGIIGVVAALTIPTLMNKTEDKELKTAWAKTYSTFANATQKIMADNADDISNQITSDDDSMKDLFEPYIKIAKDCSFNNYVGICWHTDAEWKQLSGSAMVNSMGREGNFTGGSGGTGAILSDGTLVRFYTHTSCSSTGVCGFISVDVNGFKKPNVIGKDIFTMHLYKNELTPFGVNDGNENSCNTSDSGMGCAANSLYQK